MSNKNKKISELTQNQTITGTEEMALERNDSNYKNKLSEIRDWIESQINTGVGDLDGGAASTVYLVSQVIDGGSANI